MDLEAAAAAAGRTEEEIDIDAARAARGAVGGAQILTATRRSIDQGGSHDVPNGVQAAMLASRGRL